MARRVPPAAGMVNSFCGPCRPRRPEMNYAFMTFSCPTATLEEVLALAKLHGYSGIEPRVEAKHNHGVELAADPHERRLIREQAADRGIAICCVATSCRYSDPATAPRHVDDTRRYIDLAAEIGCSA